MKFKVSGMSCAACSARVERAVRSVDGVSDCTVNLLTGDLAVEGEALSGAVESAVTHAGYGISAVGAGDAQGSGAEDEAGREDAAARRTLREQIARLVISVVLVLALMYFSMGHMIGLPLPFGMADNPLSVGLIEELLAVAVMIINKRFFINGVKGVIHGAPNMDTLVSLGSLSAFGYSVGILFAMCFDSSIGIHGLYFESAAMILTLISLGKLLETMAKGRTTDAIKSLVSMNARSATLLVDGEERTVPISEVKVGDIFVIRTGERIPTDAEVIDGECAADESALTGESIPADKTVGSVVYGATTVASGYALCRATKVGEYTAFAAVIRMVKDVSATKAPIARLADKVAGVFVPVVLGIAAVTFCGWLIAGRGLGYAIGRGISVLVISCPCALGLATPVAIMVGSGVGARRGVLFKNATALEQSGRVRTVVLDKTGTITVGSPSVTDVVSADRERLLSVACSIEKRSEHPLGRAIYRFAAGEGARECEVTDFKVISGRGVSATVDGVECLGVSFERARELVQLEEEAEAAYTRLAEEGKTPIIFIEDGRYLGMIALRDEIKADAAESVSALKRMGIRVVMLTGDNERTARSIASEVGIDDVIAGVLPDGKEAAVRELMGSGRVAMVGDGINDAPALTRADVGIAIGAGADVAVDSADVVVSGNRLGEVVNAVGIGRATLRNIRENLFWAFVYNCVGIPLAAGLFGLTLDPMFGALAMSLSSFCVVINALRLNLYRSRLRDDKTAKGCSDNHCGGNGHAINACGTTDEKEEVNNNDKEINDNESEGANTMEKIYKVKGMMCPHCEGRVRAAVEAVDGVSAAVADHKSESVSVRCNGEVDDAAIVKAITDAGYKVEL